MLRIIVMLMPAHPRASSVQVHSLLPLLGPFPCLVCPTLGHDGDDEGPTGGSSFAKLSEGITRTHVNRMAMAMDSRGFWFLAGSCCCCCCCVRLHFTCSLVMAGESGAVTEFIHCVWHFAHRRQQGRRKGFAICVCVHQMLSNLMPM